MLFKTNFKLRVPIVTWIANSCPTKNLTRSRIAMLSIRVYRPHRDTNAIVCEVCLPILSKNAKEYAISVWIGINQGLLSHLPHTVMYDDFCTQTLLRPASHTLRIMTEMLKNMRFVLVVYAIDKEYFMMKKRNAPMSWQVNKEIH